MENMWGSDTSTDVEVSSRHGFVRSAGVWSPRLALLPVFLFPVSLAVIAWSDLDGIFEPAFLLPLLNAMFSFAVSFIAAGLAAKSYMLYGPSGALLMGCGLLAFGTGSLMSGLFVGRGANCVVTVNNSGVLVSSALYLLCSIRLNIGEDFPHAAASRRGATAAGAYLATVLGVVGVYLVCQAGGTPVFFVQGVGVTPPHQAVLLLAIVFHSVAAAMFLLRYRKTRSLFPCLFGLALILIAMGLAAMFFQTMTGTILSWAGRGAQYLGGIYILAAMISLLREASRTGDSPEAAMRDFFADFETACRPLVKNSPDLIAAFDRNLCYVYVNPAALELTGRPPSFFIGKTIREIGLDEENLGKMETGLRTAFDRGTVQTREIEYTSGNDRLVLSTEFIPRRDWSGRTAGVLGVARDVTKRKRIERELIEARDRAEAANRAKTSFLSNMSHEIRTPLNGVLGMVMLARRSSSNPKVKGRLDMARQSGEHLLSIVNNILDLSKIEAGKVALKDIEFDLTGEIGAVVGPLRIAAEEKGLAFSFSLERDLPRTVVGDPGLLRQVLANLLGNAVKFTERGNIDLQGSVLERSDRFAKIGLAITDTGVGIPPESLNRVFDSFTQEETASNGTYGGSGLGLAISKRLVEMMGGAIRVESRVGFGSTFTVAIPVRISEMAVQAEAKAEEGAAGGRRRFRVLVVDDEKIGRIYSKEVLSELGHEAILAESSEEALALLAEGGVDVVLMDIGLPGMKGDQLTRLIRQNTPPGVDPRIPIIALSAYALKDEIDRYMESGFDNYLTKPFDIDKLAKILSEIG